jgi:glycosyltransferase involved in cell wall biosynthesis
VRLGFHGRFVGAKRIDRFLDVAARVAREHPLQAVLVGDGPLMEEVQATARQLGLDAEFTGYRMDLQDIVRGFDVEIIPSDTEYFGLAVIEAIQAGHPTFVFADGGGCSEIFDERTGWFICADVEEMAAKILALREPATASRVLSDMAYLQERVARSFSRDRLGEGYLEIYTRLRDAAAGT